MLYNGYGEHNIQGIGDKHIPLIHNVMNTDIVVGVSDRSYRRAQRSLQHGGGPRLPRHETACRSGARGRARRISACRASPTWWPPSRSAKHLDLDPIGRDRHRRDGQRRDVRERARALPRGAALPRGFDEVARRRSLRGPSARGGRGPLDRAHPRRPQAHLQSGLLHLGRAAGRLRSRSSIAAGTRPSGASCRSPSAPGTG